MDAMTGRTMASSRAAYREGRRRSSRSSSTMFGQSRWPPLSVMLQVDGQGTDAPDMSRCGDDQVHIARFLVHASGNGACDAQCNNGMGLCEKGDDTKTFPSEMFLSEGDAVCMRSVVGALLEGNHRPSHKSISVRQQCVLKLLLRMDGEPSGNNMRQHANHVRTRNTIGSSPRGIRSASLMRRPP